MNDLNIEGTEGERQRKTERNKARTGPRSAARFCGILKLCNNFIYIHFLRKYK